MGITSSRSRDAAGATAGTPARTFLFLLNSYPDIDHVAPLMWECLERGDRTVAVFEQAYAWEQDYRLKFLARYPGFKVRALPRPSVATKLAKAAARSRANYWTLRGFLRREAVSAVFFEWGPGLPTDGVGAGVGRHPTGGGKGARDWVKAMLLTPLRLQLLRAAKSVGVAAFCLPHGLNMKLNLDINPHVIETLEKHGGALPFADRNSFTAYVFNTAYHRDMYVAHARMDAAIAVAWGSLRFCPQWMDVIARICPPAGLPSKRAGRTRVVFFLPKWNNRVDKAATLALLDAVAARPDIELVLKMHPRKGAAELDASTMATLAARGNVLFAGDADSPAIVRECDAVIDVGSSIAMEAVLQGKHLIYPAYLHANRLVFDEYGGCLLAHSAGDVHAFLDQIATGTPPAVDPAAVRALVSHVVFSGREPYNVPAYYHEQVMRYVAATPARSPQHASRT